MSAEIAKRFEQAIYATYLDPTQHRWLNNQVIEELVPAEALNGWSSFVGRETRMVVPILQDFFPEVTNGYDDVTIMVAFEMAMVRFAQKTPENLLKSLSTYRTLKALVEKYR